ncbi:30S ribosomal protein S1 [Ostreibacterium oceani]|uniref:30S ribosomal protein S1 n=1 Tax=Ostreibacterium oceani TaxID=2654998 RepID=A0A6N7EYI9_9GAMM|nr:30S ribosomal protein S1 [Ostreibacterium oceani]MPV86207.1 30S ribosomal protein S1 [Ostreibacterium oceani]
MTESFADLFEKSLDSIELEVGTIVTATVADIGKDFVVVNAGLKSEGFIPVSEFANADGEMTLNVGDEVEVALEAVENGFGETRLSFEKAKRLKAWKRLEGILADEVTVTGQITGSVKGGFTVDLGDIRAFLPGSLVDVRPVKDPSYLKDKDLEFKVIKLDEKRNNVVVSRRAVVESEYKAEREQLLTNLKEGDVIKGVVKNLTDYGAFLDLGGVDGLLHITDMSWKRIKYPSEVVNIGDEIDVKVLRFEKDRDRVSLGLKQLGEDPWEDISRRYQVGTRHFGKVSNVADYGCFIELEDGVEGLVHVSEMDWTNKNVNPRKFVSLGQETEVMILEIDEERRRISLGMKQCQSNPWTDFATKYQKGDTVKGAIKSITDFGVFIGLEGDIDGLIHLSDLSWNKTGEEAVRDYSKGQEIEAIILAVDSERERISLGIKQLDKDPFSTFLGDNGRGAIVTGKVSEVTPQAATVLLADDVVGELRASEFSQEQVDDLTTKLSVGDEVEAKITNIDRKTKQVSLSIRAKDQAEEKATIKDFMRSETSTSGTSLGDIFKELKDD